MFARAPVWCMAMADRLVVTGVTGHLGARVARRAAAAGWSVVGTCFRAASSTAVPSERLDIRDRATVHELLRRVRPDVVVHTAAGRDDWRVMADGAAHVAVATVALGIRLVHVSSDAVFSGRDIDYDESALPDPIYPYGAAKAAAETAVAAIDPAAAIVRTSLIVGDGGGQHEILTRDLIAGRVQGALFTDLIRKPVHVDDLSDALLELAATDHRGVLNVAGADPISRYDLGVLVAQREGLDPVRIPAATIADSGTRMAADVRLSTRRAVSLLRTRLRGVHDFIGGPHAPHR
ncbi:sugar nucleotide-binding protein [Actinocatenispora rupis]